MNETFEKAASFIWENARFLEMAVFDYHFRNGQAKRIIDILRTYQDEEGGFGHALEPDLRAPDSHPLFVEFALRMLHESGLRAPEMAYRACDFLARYSDLTQGIPTLLPSSQAYPRAIHWHNPANTQPSLDRLTSLVGLAAWQGVDHPWLGKAVEACLEYISNTSLDDAHILSNAFCLVEGLAQSHPVDELFNKLKGELFKASYFVLETPVRTYGLTPLEFAPSPNSYCRQIFTEAQINAHLDELQASQQEDGGWPILWEPPGDMARCEWRGHKTVMALVTLRAYGRL